MEWWNIWVFLLFMAILGRATGKAIGKSPGLADERRAASSNARPWDLVVVRLLNLALPVMMVLAALNQRFATLSPVHPAVSGAAFTGMIVAAVVTYRAIAVNPFFSSYVRVQKDRGHAVVAAGPYRFVRHPGYAGAVMFNLLAPMALGSWIAMPVGVIVALLLGYRTAKEDTLLTKELPGYAEYVDDVPWRLLPWVW